jgi:hypothetical protein
VTESYPVVAWDPLRVLAGTLTGSRLDGHWVDLTIPLLDIRNCAASSAAAGAIVSAVDGEREHRALWWFALEGSGSQLLVELDYVLYGSVDASGRYVCFTAPPTTSRGDMSLHLLDRQEGRSDLLMDGSVARSCIPDWRRDKILFHTKSREIVELDPRTRRSQPLLQGEHPASSADGTRIAYQEGNRLRMTGDEVPTVDITPRRGARVGTFQGGISWAPDGRHLLFGQSTGILGEETEFFVLDTQTKDRTKIRQRYLQGIAYAR